MTTGTIRTAAAALLAPGPALVRRAAAVLAAGLALAAGLPPAAEPPRPGAVAERARTRIYTLRLRIEPTWVAAAAECRRIGPADLRVRLRGARIVDPALLRLDRDREPALHALVIDTSRSMGGRLERVREAAIGYVEALDPDRDRALVVTFDDGVVLAQAPTADRGRLVEAIGRVRIGHRTSLHDALIATLGELEVQRERPVLVLLTDGVDSSSFHDRNDVLDRLALRPELTIFAVGLGLPPPGSAGAPALLSAAKFLQQLAARTQGAFLAAPTTSQLGPAGRRIRELLDDELTLSVIDPDPDAEPGRLRVELARSGCTVRVLQGEGRGPGSAPGAAPSPLVPERRFAFEPGATIAEMQRGLHVHRVDPACEPPRGTATPAGRETTSWIDVGDGALVGCVLDVTMDHGVLHDPYHTLEDGSNRWVRLRARPFLAPLPPVGDLPTRPELLLDRLAAHALSVAGDEVETDGRRLPPSEHARPYDDHPGLICGRTWLDLRAELARALYARQDYRQWLSERLRGEAERDRSRLIERLRRLAPGLGERELQAVLEQSDEARSVRPRAERPARADLVRHLAAWLGDVSAHELFVGWEAERIVRLLGGDRGGEPNAASFPAAWVELRRVFVAPSYTRSLVLAQPARDGGSGPVGYWQVILPRAAWIERRVEGRRRHPDLAGLPLDLVPDLPLGFWLASRLVASAPGLAAALRARDYSTATVSYELVGPEWKHDPLRAFARSRITLHLAAAGRAGAALRLAAEIELRSEGRAADPRIVGLELLEADAELTPLFEAAGPLVHR